MSQEMDLTKLLNKILIPELDAQALKCNELNKFHLGEAPLPVIPIGASTEHKALAAMCRQPWATLGIRTLAAHIKTERYATADGRAHPSWKIFREQVASKEGLLYECALAFGHGYMRVRTDAVGAVRVDYLSPLDCAVFFEDSLNDLEPVLALIRGRNFIGQGEYYEILDTVNATRFIKKGRRWEQDGEPQPHGFSSVPVQRYVQNFNPLTGAVIGSLEPIIESLKAVWQAEYVLQATLKWNSWKMPIFTGIDLPEPTINPDTGEVIGDAVQDMKMNLAREQILLFGKNKEAGPDEEKVGVHSLAETSILPLIAARDAAVGILMAHLQASPTLTQANRENVSNDTLITEETPARRKVEGLQDVWGVAHERLMRLICEADPNDAATVDPEARMLWKTVDQSTVAQLTDAWIKIAQGLKVPHEFIWNRLGFIGVSPEDVDDMKRVQAEAEAKAARMLETAFGDANNLTAEEEESEAVTEEAAE